MIKILSVFVVVGCFAVTAKAQIISKAQRNSAGVLVTVTTAPGKPGSQGSSGVKAAKAAGVAAPKPDRIIKPNDLISTANQAAAPRKEPTVTPKYDKIIAPN
jgi:hypothetical protein